MFERLKRLQKCEDGAVTTDWVVLTAAIMGLNIFAIIQFIEGGLEIASYDILSSVLEVTD